MKLDAHLTRRSLVAATDYVLHQFMIAPAKDAEVTSVLLARGEEVLELPAGESAVYEDAE